MATFGPFDFESPSSQTYQKSAKRLQVESANLKLKNELKQSGIPSFADGRDAPRLKGDEKQSK